MTTAFDTERFIEEIHYRPCLWNNTLNEFSNKAVKMEAWNEVAAVVCDDGVSLDKKTKTKRIKELQKKWKGLRDYYNREKNRSCVTAKKRERDTPILDMLHFLKVNVPRITAPSTEGHEEIAFYHKHEDDSNDSRSSSVYFTPKKKTKWEEQKKDDPNMSFLLTLLPDMKAMTPRQNFEFRFEVMKLVKKIVYSKNDNQLVSCTVLSPSNISGTSEDRKCNVRIVNDNASDGTD